MSFTRDFHSHGSEDYRDKSFKDKGREGFGIGNRFVQKCHEIYSIEPVENLRDRGSGTPDNSNGDLLGPVFFQTKTPGKESDDERPIGSWWHGCPVIVTEAAEKPKAGESGVTTKTKCLPIRFDTYAADKRYVEKEFKIPSGSEPPPIGTNGILYSATKEDGEAELVFIQGAGPFKLLAPNKKGSRFDMGTYVYDLTGSAGDEPDEEFKAHLQTFWRVVRPKLGRPTKSGERDDRTFFEGITI